MFYCYVRRSDGSWALLRPDGEWALESSESFHFEIHAKWWVLKNKAKNLDEFRRNYLIIQLDNDQPPGELPVPVPTSVLEFQNEVATNDLSDWIEDEATGPLPSGVKKALLYQGGKQGGEMTQHNPGEYGRIIKYMVDGSRKFAEDIPYPANQRNNLVLAIKLIVEKHPEIENSERLFVVINSPGQGDLQKIELNSNFDIKRFLKG